MDSFWVEIGHKNINIDWLVKITRYLDKIDKEQQKIK